MRRLAVLCAMAALATGCESIPLGPLSGLGSKPVASGVQMNSEAQAAFTSALERALGVPGSDARTFSAGGVSGAITAGEARLVGVLNDRQEALPAPGGLKVAYAMEIDQAPATTPSPVNIRLAPVRDGARVGQSDAGERFEVYGRLMDVDWLLIGKPGRAVGYLYAPLATEVSGGLLLAGAPVRNPRLCRDWEANLIIKGDPQTITGTACTEDDVSWSRN